MKVEKIITKHIVTVNMDDTLKVIDEIFETAQFHHLLVTGDTKLVGVISDRDLLKAISPYANSLAELPRDAATFRKKAHQIMSRNPITINSDANVLEAAHSFIANKISCLPVLDKDGHIAGILTWRDILKAICLNTPYTAQQGKTPTIKQFKDQRSF